MATNSDDGVDQLSNSSKQSPCPIKAGVPLRQVCFLVLALQGFETKFFVPDSFFCCHADHVSIRLSSCVHFLLFLLSFLIHLLANSDPFCHA